MPTYKEIMEGSSGIRRAMRLKAAADKATTPEKRTSLFNKFSNALNNRMKSKVRRKGSEAAFNKDAKNKFYSNTAVKGKNIGSYYDHNTIEDDFDWNGAAITEGIRRAVRLMNKVYKKGKPVTDDTTKTKAYADFIGMQNRHAAKQARRGGASPEEIKGKTSADIEKKIKGMKRFQDTATVKRQEAGYKGKMK